MIGDNDFDIFLNTDEFAKWLTLEGGGKIKGIAQYGEDNQFAGLVEGREIRFVISAQDYESHKPLLARDKAVTLDGKAMKVESYAPYGQKDYQTGDFGYGVLSLAV